MRNRMTLMGLFAALVVALAAMDHLLGLGSGATLAVGTMVAGRASTSDTPAGHAKMSVSDKLTYIDSSSFPFTTLLQRLGLFGKPKDIHHRWPKIGRYPRSVTVSGAHTAGSAGASKAVVVDDTQLIQAGDILKAPDNTTTAGAEFIVTAVDTSTETITLYALPSSYTGTSYQTAQTLGTVPAFADNEVLYWTSNLKTEGDTASAGRSMEPQYDFNYVQTFDATVEITDHMMRQENHGGIDDWARMRRDSLYEFRKSMEAAAIFNERVTAFTEPVKNKKAFSMKGLFGFAGDSISLASSPTEANIVDFVYSAFENQNGSRRVVLFAGSDLCAPIDKVNAGTALNVMRNEKVAGVEVTGLQGRKGRIDVIYHPLFDELGYGDQGLIVDLNHVGRRDYQAVEQRKLNLKEQGVDAEGEYYITKWTLEARNPGTIKRVSLS